MRVRDDVPMDEGRGIGQSVAVDGPFAVLANPFGETPNYEFGYLSVYRWDEQFQKWDYEQRINPSNASSSGPISFGWSLDIDGNTILAGSYQGPTTNFRGQAYFIERDPASGTWSEVGIVSGSPSFDFDNFGFAVAIDNDLALVTADNAAYFYARSGGSWSQTQRINTRFAPNQAYGVSGDLSGQLAVVGVPKQGGNRAVVYRNEGGTWVEEQVLTGSDTAIGDEFGNAVAISGNTIAVGAHLYDGNGGNSGAIYMFERDPDTMTWTETQTIYGAFGGLRLTGTLQPSRGLALDGDELIAASWGSDRSYRYRRSGDTWVGAGEVVANSAVSAGGGTIAASQNEIGQSAGYADVFRCEDVDTDGDGLLDKWETAGEGYDVNLDGIVDINLYDRGARPDRKDLFYEIDRMVGVPFETGAIEDVIEAFANAAVLNPDGSTGISLHFDLVGIDDIPFDSEWDDFGTEYTVAKDLYWGTPSERVDPNAEAILEAKRDIYRYAAIVNGINDGALGIAEVPGDDLICAFGALANDQREQALTLMHEIGHNLNLGHGGVVQDDGGTTTLLGDVVPVPDHTNFKPNYVSVMNYGFTEFYDFNGDDLRADFSRERLDPIDEGNLNENVGISTSYSIGVLTIYGRRNPGEMPDSYLVELGTSTIDWNKDGQLDSGLAIDLNWLGSGYPDGDAPSPGEILHGCNDWESIVLRFLDTLEYQQSQHIAPTEFDEITIDELHYMRENVPQAPGACPADLNDDGELNFFDVSAFLTAYNMMDPVADFNGDSMFNFFDVSAFLTAYNAGCP
ncbi:MAG: GC-type dockerin domain-anchored protein [Phycisphaerales bacterium]